MVIRWLDVMMLKGTLYITKETTWTYEVAGQNRKASDYPDKFVKTQQY